MKPPLIITVRLLLLMLALAGVTQGQGGITSKRTLAAILANTPEPEIVPHGMAMKTAEHISKEAGDSHVLWGTGDSMLPLYAQGTALIVVRQDYETLTKGMTVVYLNQEGWRVAHCIVGEIVGGYLVQGLNNAAEDEELLTEDNFVGVVVAAYGSVATDFRADTLAKLSPKARALLARQ